MLDLRFFLLFFLYVMGWFGFIPSISISKLFHFSGGFLCVLLSGVMCRYVCMYKCMWLKTLGSGLDSPV